MGDSLPILEAPQEVPHALESNDAHASENAVHFRSFAWHPLGGELCAEYGISRKTAYKWIDRYIRRGPAGLEDRSRRPRRAPNATAPGVVNALVELRHRHPTWGAKKLLAFLARRHPDWSLPGRSVTCALLKRRGLVLRKTPRRAIGHPGKPSPLILAPNQMWCADFKGQFRMGNGRYCYPLTVTDGYSRFLLGCQGLTSTAVRGAKPVFARLFQEHGLPQYIRTDNGVPFATNTLARLSDSRPGGCGSAYCRS